MNDFVLTLTQKPTKSLLAKIRSWLTAEIEEKVELKINVDKNILGGAIIEYKGRYKDFSLRKVLEKLT